MESQELKLIKKIYGEEMMHLCRDLFPTLLETPYQVYNILEKNIAPTKSLATDIIENFLEEEFKNYIYSFIDVEQEQIETDKTPSELLKEKGYILYECNTEEEIQKFKKYYSKDEELCTFRNNRLKRCYVFFAVKENVEEIKREDFNNPDRQDLYGTSVISIQFSKDENNTLSIKNRYNHTVKNPDATYSNNLENIIPGLTNSFEKYYGLNITQETNNYSSFLTNKLKYVKCNNKYYRYNYEINNIYYCETNIIIDNGRLIDKYSKEKERYILIDYFIIDKKEKTISLYDKTINDSFIDSVNGIGNIKDIISTKDKNIIIKYEDEKQINIRIDKSNNIISYKNDYVKIIEDNFLYCNQSLISIELSKVKVMEDNFLYWNKSLTNIKLPKVEIIGNSFLCNNVLLEKIELPKVEVIGNCFLYFNPSLISIEFLKVETIGNCFLCNNFFLEKIELPNVKNIGKCFLSCSNYLQMLKLPKVEIIGDKFLFLNKSLKSIELPNVKQVGDHFLESNQYLKVIKEKGKLKVYKK